jgi:hypothetical protein
VAGRRNCPGQQTGIALAAQRTALHHRHRRRRGTSEATWRHQIGKDCELAVPVMYRDVLWGELCVTGRANRRELERRFDEMDWETVRPAILVCDLDRFKFPASRS